MALTIAGMNGRQGAARFVRLEARPTIPYRFFAQGRFYSSAEFGKLSSVSGFAAFHSLARYLPILFSCGHGFGRFASGLASLVL